MTTEEWATIVGAVATALAVFVALGAHFWQVCHERRKVERIDTAALLALQELAHELSRMIVLVGYQHDSPDNEVLYPDPGAEFAAISEFLGKLPIERLSVLGKMPVFLHLRRISAELAIRYAPASAAGSKNVYFQNRTRFEKLRSACSTYSIQLAEEIKKRDKKLYLANQEQMTAL